jgi:hypothetical protein
MKMNTATLDRDEAIKRIKAALKRRSGKAWSVTGGKGTAWGWIEIDATPKNRTWQWIQTTSPEVPSEGAYYGGAYGLTPGYRVGPGAEDRITSPADDPWAREAVEMGRSVIYNWEVNRPDQLYGHMSPADREELASLLGLTTVHYQGESIAASSDHRREYVDRAEGRTPSVIGQTYWD